MQVFGAVNTSIPGRNGFTVLPSAGYFSQKLSGANVAPIGDNLVLTTDYIISEIGGGSNEIYAVDSAGSQVRLEACLRRKLAVAFTAGKSLYLHPPRIRQLDVFLAALSQLHHPIQNRVLCVRRQHRDA